MRTQLCGHTPTRQPHRGRPAWQVHICALSLWSLSGKGEVLSYKQGNSSNLPTVCTSRLRLGMHTTGLLQPVPSITHCTRAWASG